MYLTSIRPDTDEVCRTSDSAKNGVPIDVDVAIFSKSVAPSAPDVTVGAPLGFVAEPKPFPPEFRTAATPPSATVQTAGLTTIDPEHQQAGAWTVRVIKDHAYLACLRHRKNGTNVPFIIDATPDRQAHFVEQITFRIPIKPWTKSAAAIAASAQIFLQQAGDLRKRMAGEGSRRLQAGLDAEAVEPMASDGGVDLASFDLSLGAPSVILHSGLIAHAAQSNVGVLPAALAQLTPTQLRWASVAYGFKCRFAGVSLQVFDEGRLSFAPEADPQAELRYCEARKRIFEDRGLREGKLRDMLFAILQSGAVQLEDDLVPDNLATVLFSFQAGRVKDLSAWSWPHQQSAIRWIEALMDVEVSRGEVTTWVEAIYSALLLSSMETTPGHLPQMLRFISHLEFGANILANLYSHQRRSVFGRLVVLLKDLRVDDPASFERLMARMTSKDTTRPIFWEAVVGD
ncbi:MAG: hypothetical protein QNJ16_15445 [Rhodobacter sp.]|nr:hypothetical protein [Rhodobacter sp.]